MTFLLILGPMFSGKTSQLLLTHKDYTYNKKGQIFLWSDDDRYSKKSKLITHSGITCPGVRLKNSEELLKYVDKIDVFSIDEIQFLKDGPTKSTEKVLEILLSMGKIVIGAGLLADYRRKVWPGVEKILGLCTEPPIFKTAFCSDCGAKAFYTYKKGHGKGKDSLEIIVSSHDIFTPLCSKCWNKKYL